MRVAKIAILVGLLLFGQSVMGAIKTDGATLLKECKLAVLRLSGTPRPDVTVKEVMAAHSCENYLLGIKNYHQTLAYTGRAPSLFCPADEVTLEQYARVVVRFLESYPEVLHLHRAGIVMEALGEAFPCTVKQG